VLPIDDSDMGWDCVPLNAPFATVTRQIGVIEMADADAITDNGQET
jgi:hypothetical protein